MTSYASDFSLPSNYQDIGLVSEESRKEHCDAGWVWFIYRKQSASLNACIVALSIIWSREIAWYQVIRVDGSIRVIDKRVVFLSIFNTSTPSTHYVVLRVLSGTIYLTTAVYSEYLAAKLMYSSTLTTPGYSEYTTSYGTPRGVTGTQCYPVIVCVWQVNVCYKAITLQ